MLTRVKMRIYSPDIPIGSLEFTSLHITCPKVLDLVLLQSHLPGENAAQFSAAGAIHTVPIFISPGSHHCCVDRGNVDSNLGFDT